MPNPSIRGAVGDEHAEHVTVMEANLKYVLMLLLAVLAGSAVADQSVRGYTRKDGTYVSPHMRSSPDGDRSNNWSSRGNVNPYTGERGYVDPYAPKPQRPSVPDYSRQKR